jgi:hypothetical protein
MSGVAPRASRASTNTLGHSKSARACSTEPMEQARASGVRPFADGIEVLRTYKDSSGRATRALRIATRSGVHGRGCSMLEMQTRKDAFSARDRDIRTWQRGGAAGRCRTLGAAGRSGEMAQLTLCRRAHRRGHCDGTLGHREH